MMQLQLLNGGGLLLCYFEELYQYLYRNGNIDERGNIVCVGMLIDDLYVKLILIVSCIVIYIFLRHL